VDSSVEDVVAEEKVSQGVKNLEEIKDILHGNIAKQEKSTRERLRQGIPKCHFRVGDENVRSQQRKGGKLEATWPFPNDSTRGEKC
ncbi:hypothetical protein F7725_026865, partial [Dissostichus mawsoni]